MIEHQDYNEKILEKYSNEIKEFSEGEYINPIGRKRKKVQSKIKQKKRNSY